MSDALDRRRVRSSALRVGLLVGVVSAGVIALGTGVIVLRLLLVARDVGTHGHHDRDRVVVDLDHVVPWVLAVGLVVAAVLALVAWLAARRAVAPLAEALRLQRHFVSDASHELRTPLTTLTSRIQILQRRLARDEPIDETLVELRRDAAVMDEVLTDMLLAAEAEAGSGAARADVAPSVAGALAAVEPLAAEHEISLVHDTADAGAVPLAAITLTRLCLALLDNAVQHAPPGSQVRITAAREGRVVRIRVSDQGAGVSDADRERIFERFARGAESGRRRGFGLGLALVRETARRHGGGVRIERSSSSGTVFVLTLPAV